MLYIEDNSSNILLMQQLVSHRPVWKMVQAETGARGLELARTAPPDLILLDLHLPDLNGFDILRELRSDPATKHLTVVMVSADASPYQIQRVLAAGASDYLVKPLKVPQLLGLLDSEAARADMQ